ncbi:hypothetical protein TL16_g02342 [Triparma laevis f. inornata]|uniref:Uncharacterized protein n=1 Tax=Triparma laevis f. inornata TaxID=1714386 RepID=A0A9W6ZQ98_9STRA|nr:hypothetical protein TL16_g02342 [Triparma laevis f. inornata]
MLNLLRMTDDEVGLLADTDGRYDDGTLKSHPLIKDAAHTFSHRMWRDWKGGLIGALCTTVVGLYMPENILQTILPLRLEIARFIAPFVCFLVMLGANYTEHVLQPPVEPAGIVSFSGKTVFFTVNVIGLLLCYFAISVAGQTLKLVGYPSETLTYITYTFFIHAYALGSMLSVFYYAGVLGDKDEKANIQKWHKRGIPLARYLHNTHSTSIFCVNLDFCFKSSVLIAEYIPTMDFVVVSLYTYGCCYASWVLFNYSITGYFPYPFMNGMGNWYFPAIFLVIMANIAIVFGIASSVLIANVKGAEMMSVAELIKAMWFRFFWGV